jgi:hypothetical protein
MAHNKEDLRLVLYFETHRKVGMAFKRRELARKDRKEDLHEGPEKYRDGHRVRLLGVGRSSRRTELLWRLLGTVIVGFLATALGGAIEFLASDPLSRSSYIAIAIFALSAIIQVGWRGYFSKSLERLMPRELPASHEAPRLAQMLLLFVSKRNREHIIGDLGEEYRTSNKRFPRLWYWGQVFALVASYWWATLRRRLGFDMALKMIRK